MPSILTRHAPLRLLEHALRIYFHIYMRLRGCGAVRCVGLLERVCKFFSKNSLRDNGFSMSHTPQSSSTSLPARQIQSAPGPPTEPPPPRSPLLQLKIQPQLHGLSTAARATITSPQHPVELLFWFRVCWGMIDDKSR